MLKKWGGIGVSRYHPTFIAAKLVEAEPAQRRPSSPLVPLKQIPRVHLVRHVRELVAPAVGHDHVAAGLEGLQVVGHLGAEELRRVQRGLVDHHGHALGLHALHDALDGARAEVVGVGLHRQAVHAHDWLLLAGVHAVPHHLQHLVGDEVLAGAVGLHDGLDKVLRHVLVVGQQLLGVLGQAVAAVAEAGVVVVAADARLQAHAVDDVAGVEAADLVVGVDLVEVGDAQRQVGVGSLIKRALVNIELVNLETRVVVHFIRKMLKSGANFDISECIKSEIIKQIAFF